jgi:D-alanyl-D-alanine dipeptidase
MPAPLVPVQSLVPDAVLDIRYATTANFLHRVLYPCAAAYLLKPTVEKLARAAVSLRSKGFRLLIHDAYRPLSAQRALWQAAPDKRFVADPARGSMHNRGAAVDAALADLDGRALAMPSDFDEFSERAAHAYLGGDSRARDRRDALRRAMEDAGFSALEAEWWHYSDPAGKDWPLLDLPFETLG